ncbi:MAG: hypothetical protein ACRDR6_08305 [Pseudonocardiaceae bacterium]
MTEPVLALGVWELRSEPVLCVELVVRCEPEPVVLADVVGTLVVGAACAVVAEAVGALDVEPVPDVECEMGVGWEPGAVPVLAAVAAAAVWLVEPAATPDTPGVVPDTPVDCAVTCPGAGWPAEMWPLFDTVPAEPVPAARNALTLPAV